jgi:hypothetical protein
MRRWRQTIPPKTTRNDCPVDPTQPVFLLDFGLPWNRTNGIGILKIPALKNAYVVSASSGRCNACRYSAASGPENLVG